MTCFKFDVSKSFECYSGVVLTIKEGFVDLIIAD